MDAGGAEALRWQLEQQAHWRGAEAVLDGRQPAVDPDRDELMRMEDGMRVYEARIVRGHLVHLCKRLIDGVWINGTLAESMVAAAGAPSTDGQPPSRP